MTYPTPSINNTGDLLVYADSITGNWLIPGFLIALAVVVYVMAKSKFYNMQSSTIMATTAALIFGSLFWAAGLLGGQIVVFILALDTLAVIWAKLSE